MRRFLLGFAGAAALGLAALAPQGAQAQGFSVQFGTGYGPSYGYPGYYYGPAPVYGRPVYGRPVYGRPFYDDDDDHHPHRCVVRVTKYWDGYEWVRERRRVCR